MNPIREILIAYVRITEDDWSKSLNQHTDKALSQIADIIEEMKCEVPEKKIADMNYQLKYVGRYNYNKAITDVANLIRGK